MGRKRNEREELAVKKSPQAQHSLPLLLCIGREVESEDAGHRESHEPRRQHLHAPSIRRATAVVPRERRVIIGVILFPF